MKCGNAEFDGVPKEVIISLIKMNVNWCQHNNSHPTQAVEYLITHMGPGGGGGGRNWGGLRWRALVKAVWLIVPSSARGNYHKLYASSATTINIIIYIPLSRNLCQRNIVLIFLLLIRFTSCHERIFFTLK